MAKDTGEHFECLHKDCKDFEQKERTFKTFQAFATHHYMRHKRKAKEGDFKVTKNPAKEGVYVRKKNGSNASSMPASGTFKIPVILEIDFDFGGVRIGDVGNSPHIIKLGIK